MGGRQSRQREQRGQDLKYEVDVDLREAYTGVKKEISYDTLVTCDVCDGSGSESGSGLKKLVVYVEVLEEQEHHKDFLLLKEHVQHVEVLDKLYQILVKLVMEKEEVVKIESLKLIFLQVLKKEVE